MQQILVFVLAAALSRASPLPAPTTPPASPRHLPEGNSPLVPRIRIHGPEDLVEHQPQQDDHDSVLEFEPRTNPLNTPATLSRHSSQIHTPEEAPSDSISEPMLQFDRSSRQTSGVSAFSTLARGEQHGLPGQGWSTGPNSVTHLPGPHSAFGPAHALAGYGRDDILGHYGFNHESAIQAAQFGAPRNRLRLGAFSRGYDADGTGEELVARSGRTAYSRPVPAQSRFAHLATVGEEDDDDDDIDFNVAEYPELSSDFNRLPPRVRRQQWEKHNKRTLDEQEYESPRVSAPSPKKYVRATGFTHARHWRRPGDDDDDDDDDDDGFEDFEDAEFWGKEDPEVEEDDEYELQLQDEADEEEEEAEKNEQIIEDDSGTGTNS